MDHNRFLSVIMPVFNEQNTVVQIIERILELEFVKEIIVVNDGSTDATRERLASFEGHRRVTLMQLNENQGKGSAIRAGLPLTTGELVIIQDADREYDPADIAKLAQPLLADEADIVFGSRRLHRPMALSQWLNPFFHGVSTLNLMVRILYGITVSDEATCYKITRRETLLAMDLKCQRFEFCPEVVAKTARMNLRFQELPIQYTPRKIAEGKKIGFGDAVEAAKTLWRYRKWSPDSETGTSE